MQDTIALIVTSEKTWPKLQTFCLNQAFQAQRARLDLAVVLNGKCEQAVEYLKTFSPEFLFTRPNYGLDPAGFDHLIKNIPLQYQYYYLLHDDHWFLDPEWFGQMRELAAAHPGVQVFGNLAKSTANYHPTYDSLSRILGYDGYNPDAIPFFVQGMAGLYRRTAMESLLELDGIPHIHRNAMPVVWLCERLVTTLLFKAGMKFMQIPPGYEQYLKHNFHLTSAESAYVPRP